jgi:hypothetical protein
LAIIAALLRIIEIEHSRRLAGFSKVAVADVVREVGDLYEPTAKDKRWPSACPARSISGGGMLSVLDEVGKMVPISAAIRASRRGNDRRDYWCCNDGSIRR